MGITVAVIFAAPVTNQRTFGASHQANIDKAQELYRAGKVGHILAVGGCDIKMFDNSGSVAKSAANWLVKNAHLPQKDVSSRGESTNCIDNVGMDVRSFLAETDQEVNELLLICEKQESARVWLTANAYGIKAKRVPTLHKLSFLGKFVELIYFLMTLIDPKASDIIWRFPQAYRLWRRKKTRR